MIEKVKFTNSPQEKALEKQTTTIKVQGRKQIDAINPNDLIYYFKGNTAIKRFDDFDNGIKFFNKIKSGDIKLEELKRLKKLCFNQI